MKTKLLISLSLLSLTTLAQVSPKVSMQYPAHIVYKIDDLISKINLDEKKQIQIAEKFIKIDSVANVSLHNGEPVTHLKANYEINKAFLKTILSIKEFENYAYEIDKDNRFLAALILKSNLKLNSIQISKIRQLNDSLESTSKNSRKETIQFYNSKLYKILDTRQYLDLIKFMYKDESLASAKEDWNKILKLKINTPGKEKEEYQQIVAFHFDKNSFLDKKADRYDKKKRDFFSLKTHLMRPPLLIHADILTNPSKTNNKYASLIQFEKDLSLSQKQIDSILVKYRQFDKIIIENREIDVMERLTLHKELPSQFENIIQIITPEQLNKWLTLKNKDESIVKAHKSWAQLESEGLIKDLNKKNIISELTIYHLRLLIAQEKSKSMKTRQNLFLVRDVEQTKPEILQQLAAITRSKTTNENAKNAMKW